MIKHQKTLKSIALFLTLTIGTEIFFPTVAWALTSGPTAPEFSSFEPVDTTDMVNLNTGDLTYNMPLLEVPGPEGGYPLSLSYHAGISPEEEASWVGLGWTLNPGAINRTVNGFSDDVNGPDQKINDYWAGGEREIWGVGLGVSGVNFGVEWGNDTYQGFGIGTNMGLSVPFSENSPFSAGIEMGADPWGNAHGSLSLGLSSQGKSELVAGGQIGIGFSNNSVSGFAGGGIGVKGGGSLVGAGISSSSGKASLSIGGTSSSMYNNNFGKISSYGYSTGISIPVYPGITLNLSHSYNRYYSNTNDNQYVFGSIYLNNAINPATQTMDSYALQNPDDPESMAKSPDEGIGGSLPAYDNYQVTGQGVGGNIQPYIFEYGALFRKNQGGDNKINYTYKSTDPNFKKITTKAQFRFRNDFSNSLIYNNKDLVSTSANIDTISSNTLINQYNGSKSYFAGGFNDTTKHLAGSKHVEWLTNGEIQIGDAYKKKGFISYDSIYSNREIEKFGKDVKDQVGGFMITNESGVTYHYSLPVYAYNEVSHSTSYDYKGVVSTRTFSNKQPYAYTWLLTAVTGPDYVDRGAYGLDDADWGYWVKFDYGKWLDKYNWRNPATGTLQDIDQRTSTYSYGSKEVYYLDAILTRSHIAIFEKTIKHDGKDIPQEPEMIYADRGDKYNPNYFVEDTLLYTLPHSLLKLNNIYLYDKKDFNNLLATNNKSQISQLKSTGNNSYNFTHSYRRSIFPPLPSNQTKIINKKIVSHNTKNVLDSLDFNNTYTNKAIKKISFNMNYQLCGKTTNSMKFSDIYQNTPPSNINLYGKLTLNAIKVLGNGGVSVLPPTTFSYSNNNPNYHKDKKDMWSYYKSDFDSTLVNKNIKQFTSDTSAKYVDSWSLTKINTPLGSDIKIDYESDVYYLSAVSSQQLLRIKNISKVNGSTDLLKVEFIDSDLNGIKLSSCLETGSNVDLNVLGFYSIDTNSRSASLPNKYTVEWGYPMIYDKNVNTTFKGLGRKFESKEAIITSIQDNFIFIRDKVLLDKLSSTFIGAGGPRPADLNSFIGNSLLSGKWDKKGWVDLIVGGIMTTSKKSNKYGGGLRVKSIEVSYNNQNTLTKYDYFDGFTIYEPFSILEPVFNPSFSSNYYYTDIIRYYYQNLTQYYSKILANNREIPGPGVFYQTVQVREKVNGRELPGYTEYKFAGYNGIETATNQTVERNINPLFANTAKSQNAVQFRDFSTRVGALLSTVNYGANGEMLSRTTNTFLNQDLGTDTTNSSFIQALITRFNGQGIVHQRFYELHNDKTVVTEKIEFPNVLVRTKSENFKTGITTESRNVLFDKFSGAVRLTSNTDAYGNTYYSYAIPAYETYSSMGLKINNIQNKNMLSQVGINYSYRTNGDPYNYALTEAQNLTFGTKIKEIVGASKQTWSKDTAKVLKPSSSLGVYSPYYNQVVSNIWRMDESFAHIDNSKPSASGLSTNSTIQWELQSKVTKYDVYSHGLEASDINNQFTATKLDPEFKKVIATAANVRYNDFAYSGAEYNIQESGIDFKEGIVSNVYSHTGQNSLQLKAGGKGFIFRKPNLEKNKAYKASVWTYIPNESLMDNATSSLYYKIDNGQIIFVSPSVTAKAGSWYLLTLIIPVQTSISILEIGCWNQSFDKDIFFDDFRVTPLLAASNAYVYSPKGELEAILDNDNLYTRFEYDAIGRLTASYKEILSNKGERQITSRKYHFKK